MKRILLLLTLSTLFTISFSQGNCERKYWLKQLTSADLKLMAASPVPAAGHITYFNADLNENLLRAEYKNHVFTPYAAFTPGIDAAIVYGTYKTNTDGSYAVVRIVSGSILLDGGALVPFGGTTKGSLSLGAALGINIVTLAGGYDFITGAPYAAVGVNLSGLIFTGGWGMYILNIH